MHLAKSKNRIQTPSSKFERYLAEFDFRYNERMRLGVNDRERAIRALRGIKGKRLTYRRTRDQQGAAQRILEAS